MKKIAHYLPLVTLYLSTTPCFSALLLQETKGNDPQEIISLKVIFSEEEEEFNLQASPQSTILDVKNMLEKETDLDAEYQKLTFKNKILEDEHILSHYIAHKSAELRLSELIKEIKFSFVPIKGQEPVAIKEDLQAQPAANQGLDWEPGLNLIGRCENATCTALYKDNVVAPKGYSKNFNIGKEIRQTKCPCCQHKLKDITNFMFSYCKYTIEGESEQSGDFNYTNTHTDINGYETFLFEEHNTKLDTFFYLEVSVEKLN